MSNLVIPDSEFLCRCKGGIKPRCIEIRKEAKRRCFDHLPKPPKDNLTFMDSMLYHLSWEGDLTMMADQWANVSYELFVIDPLTKKYDKSLSKHCSFMCDSIIDGICACYLWMLQEKGK